MRDVGAAEFWVAMARMCKVNLQHLDISLVRLAPTNYGRLHDQTNVLVQE